MPIISQKRMLFITDFPDNDPRWQDHPPHQHRPGHLFKFESGSLMCGKAREDTPDSPGHHLRAGLLRERDQPGHPGAHAPPPPSASSSAAGPTCTTPTPPTTTPSSAGTQPPEAAAAVGYSGHGAQQGPAVGLCLAELVVTGQVPDRRLHTPALDPVPGGGPGQGDHRHLGEGARRSSKVG